jgi:hypothetical protein
LDLFVINNRTQGNNVYLNDGNGIFTTAGPSLLTTDLRPSRGTCSADIENDGDIDIMVVGSTSRLYVNDGTGQFIIPPTLATFSELSISGWACAFGDYDQDGFADMVVTHPAGFLGGTGRPNYLFRNKGDGTFESVKTTPVTVGLAPYTVATWSDFDLDGDIDLFIGAGPASAVPGPDFLFRNMKSETGTATFERYEDPPLGSVNRDGQVFSWIDFDNDRDLDVLITNWGAGLGGLADELYENDGGVFVPVTEGDLPGVKRVSLGASWGDYDNDGDLDVYITDGAGGRSGRMYVNNNGVFTDALPTVMAADRAASWGSSAGDIDGDGDLDLFIANSGNPFARNFFYRNELSNSNHWLIVRLTGIQSNASGIGARIHVRAQINGETVWQVRDLSSQNTFNGHDAMEAHFGLGDATIADSVVVEWPSGIYDGLAGVTIDRAFTITEGSHPVSVIGSPKALASAPVVIHIFPNPTSSSATAELTILHHSDIRLHLFDVLGRDVRQVYRGSLQAGRHLLPIDVEGLSPGLYLLRDEADVKDGNRIASIVNVVR